MKAIEKAKINSLKKAKRMARSERRKVAHGCAIFVSIFFILPGIAGSVELGAPIAHMLWCVPFILMDIYLGMKENWFVQN